METETPIASGLSTAPFWTTASLTHVQWCRLLCLANFNRGPMTLIDASLIHGTHPGCSWSSNYSMVQIPQIQPFRTRCICIPLRHGSLVLLTCHSCFKFHYHPPNVIEIISVSPYQQPSTIASSPSPTSIAHHEYREYLLYLCRHGVEKTRKALSSTPWPKVQEDRRVRSLC